MSGIKGFLETSFVDWPGRVCAVVFLGGCNLRCPFCHNASLVTESEKFPDIPVEAILARLAPYRAWLGGVCVSGGEPTLSRELPGLLQRLKRENWAVKLDTNGTRPRVLAQLLAEDLVDMVAMDVKAPLDQEKYNRCAGTPVNLEHLAATISLIRQSGIAHEFRMTVMPLLHTEDDIGNWADQLRPNRATATRLKLQNFNPRATLVAEFGCSPPFSGEDFDRLQSIVA
ncbi:MAG: anaerobic ribonucleoside-triphosphate reductase activating protein [Deltaproteobacteria bacterium RIFOXYD12_FULL_57_12]|nr:MAG: anaerobic ribonucleoside-triphosphate reductase activating protein [Deltaproteobacteria bacterium RIFOXYD12_FULL_57_12]